jgi:hypothetical protein
MTAPSMSTRRQGRAPIEVALAEGGAVIVHTPPLYISLKIINTK